MKLIDFSKTQIGFERIGRPQVYLELIQDLINKEEIIPVEEWENNTAPWDLEQDEQQRQREGRERETRGD